MAGVDPTQADDSDRYVDEESWVDMHVGETGSIYAKLASVGFGSPGNVVVTFANWSDLAIEVENPRAITKEQIPLSSHVVVRVRRTEDGLEGLMIKLIENGVPIPLLTPR